MFSINLRHIVLGGSGLKTSVLGIGFWQIGSRFWKFRGKNIGETVYKIVEKAYSNGINFFDTAEIYGGGLSEKYLGEAIRKLDIVDEVVVASKVAGYKHLSYTIVKAVEKINRRLGFKVSLIQHHWPPPFYGSICRVVHGMEKAVEKGLTSYYGLSNYDENTLLKVLECSKKYEPVSNQLQYSLGYRVVENRLLNIMGRNKISLIAWSPLAKGALAGLTKPITYAQKFDRVFKQVASDYELQSVLNKLAEKYRISKSAIALAWLIHKGAIPIPGTRRIKRIDEYIGAIRISLSDNDLELLDKITEKYKWIWGKHYGSMTTRYIPGFLQCLVLKLLGGV